MIWISANGSHVSPDPRNLKVYRTRTPPKGTHTALLAVSVQQSFPEPTMAIYSGVVLMPSPLLVAGHPVAPPPNLGVECGREEKKKRKIPASKEKILQSNGNTTVANCSIVS